MSEPTAAVPHDYDALLRRLTFGLDVPPWLLGVGSPPPPRPRSCRERLAGHVGQAGWRLGSVAVLLGRRTARAYAVGSAITDGGDWLAARVAGR